MCRPALFLLTQQIARKILLWCIKTDDKTYKLDCWFHKLIVTKVENVDIQSIQAITWQ